MRSLPILLTVAALTLALVPAVTATACPRCGNVGIPANAGDSDQPISAHRYLDWYADMYERRMIHVARLAEYCATGNFPYNADTAGRTPVFIDARGVPCAMGYLLLQDGQRDLVDRIVAADNLIRLSELDPSSELGAEIMTWLRTNGLTLAEASRVQPSYDPIEPVPFPVPDPIVNPVVVQRERIQAHLRRVVTELQLATIDSLQAQLAARVAAEGTAEDGAAIQIIDRSAAQLGRVFSNIATRSLRVAIQPLGDGGMAVGRPQWQTIEPGASITLPGRNPVLLLTVPAGDPAAAPVER